MVWEGKRMYTTLDEALQGAEKAIENWFEKMGKNCFGLIKEFRIRSLRLAHRNPIHESTRTRSFHKTSSAS